jgi:hypothetical protein
MPFLSLETILHFLNQLSCCTLGIVSTIYHYRATTVQTLENWWVVFLFPLVNAGEMPWNRPWLPLSYGYLLTTGDHLPISYDATGLSLLLSKQRRQITHECITSNLPTVSKFVINIRNVCFRHPYSHTFRAKTTSQWPQSMFNCSLQLHRTQISYSALPNVTSTNILT